MALLEDLTKKARSGSKGFRIEQVLTIVATLAVVVLVFVVLLRWAMKPDYSILFANLDLKDADQIVESLRSAGVPHKVSAGGSTVMVPQNDVSEWRMRLATQGLPASGTVGYEVFDKNEIGISDFVQQVNYIRALEGELARTIQGIGDIDQSRVHIVIPKDRLFKEDQNDPTASVVLKLRTGGLSEGQIHGISNLVAASVEGLEPFNVTVVDSDGNVLSKPYGEDTVLGLSSTQLELQRKVESQLAQKAQSMLASVLGQGKSVVRVSAELNFQKIDRTDERYDADNVAILSEQRTDESSMDSLGNPQLQSEQSVTNYHVPKTVEHVSNAVGNILRLSVAVLIDGVREKVVDDEGNESWDYTPRSAADMNVFSTIVKNAVGFNPERNDQFEIQNIPFDTSVPPEEPAPVGFFEQQQDWLSMGQKAVPFVFLLVFLLIIRSKMKKIKVTLPPTGAAALPVQGVLPPEMEELPSLESGVLTEGARLLRQISNFTEDKPALAAKLLRYWMIEE